MARNPPEIHLMEGRDLLLLPRTVLGTRAAGCSCNIMGPLTPGVRCLLRFVNCHLVILEVMLSIPLSGSTVMATELKASPLSQGSDCKQNRLRCK
jgi:hypothetical protein